MILLQGKSLLRSQDALERDLACEAALRPSSDAVALARADVDGLDIVHRQLDMKPEGPRLDARPSPPATREGARGREIRRGR